MEEFARKAKVASLKLQNFSTDEKNRILDAVYLSLIESKTKVLASNELDLTTQKDLISKQLLSRLDLRNKYDSLLQGIKDVISLPDPNGRVLMAKELDVGLELFKVTCPVGVILIIFEARPEVVVQISSLAIKSGNAVILKGGKEALNSNLALFKCVQEGLDSVFPGSGDAVQMVTEREDIGHLLKMDEFIDLVIPRGSNQLVRYVKQNTSIPVIGHSDGICFAYLDKEIDQEMAIKIVIDGKINYPAACNATEAVLLHKESVSILMPLVEALLENKVQIKLEAQLYNLFPFNANVQIATEDDFKTEFVDLIIAIKSVGSLEEAVDHINTYGSHHTDCIISSSHENAKIFMKQVASANVYHNCSTRFADGFRYGFGAEIGVSTCKTHARGPVGLEGLMIYKYQLCGNGHIVGDYSHKPFTHKDLKNEYGYTRI